MNPAVPHVLALAMKESQQKSGSTVGIKSKSLEENKQGKNFEVQDWEGEDMNLQVTVWLSMLSMDRITSG